MTDSEIVHDVEVETGVTELEPVTVGVVEEGKNAFFFYPHNQVTYRGKKVDFFHLEKPNARKLKSNKVAISDNMEIAQMENMISACVVRIVDQDDDEFASADKRSVILELLFDDLLILFNAVQERFLAALTG